MIIIICYSFFNINKGLSPFHRSHSLLHHGSAAQAPSASYGDATSPAHPNKPQPNQSKLCLSFHALPKRVTQKS